jgi:hypothetical protein
MGFFCQLERLNSRTFAGFQPTKDLVYNISRLKLAPPRGYGSKWHRGIGPMAFAGRSLNDIGKQTEKRDLRNTYRDHLTLTMADTKKLESTTPLVPADFEAFLLLLHPFNDFHLAAFGPSCDICIKTTRVVTNLTTLRHRIARSPEFMPMRAPSIIWMLTVATQEFYAEAATATQFATAGAQGDAPPRTSFNLDVSNVSKLCVTEACDLPAFLRNAPARPPPHAANPFRPSPATAPSGPARGPPARTPTSSTNVTSPRPATRARVTPGSKHVNPNLPPQFTTFLSNVAPAERETLGLKKILEGCPNCTYSTLMSHLGTTNATCLRYHILGTCALSN